ncbi:MAG: 30S ribosomal protein S6 [bacterium]
MADIELMQVYELGLNLVPTIAEENVATVFGDMKAMLEKHGAVFVSEEYPKMRPLAYTMIKTEAGRNERYNFAYFGWIKYELPRDAALDVKTEVEKNKNVLRSLILKTVRENTLYSNKIPRKEGDKPESKEDIPSIEITPESEAEIDKTIDELVVE